MREWIEWGYRQGDTVTFSDDQPSATQQAEVLQSLGAKAEFGHRIVTLIPGTGMQYESAGASLLCNRGAAVAIPHRLIRHSPAQRALVGQLSHRSQPAQPQQDPVDLPVTPPDPSRQHHGNPKRPRKNGAGTVTEPQIQRGVPTHLI